MKIARKEKDFFKRKADELKRQKLDATGSFQEKRGNIVEASYRVAYLVARKKKPHTIAEELILPCAKEMVRLVHGVEAAQKLSDVSLSNNTIQRIIGDMSGDVKDQIIEEIKASPIFAIQADESTDVAMACQLLVYCRYLFKAIIKEEFLCCQNLETSSTATDVMNAVSSFFDKLTSMNTELHLAYLVDIFEIFNQLNLRLQGKDSNLLSHCDSIHALLAKLELCKKRVSVGKFMMFPSLNEVLADGQLSSTLSKEIMDHLSQLDDEFRCYFPDLSPQHAGLAKNPFLCQVDDVLEDAQGEFIELIHDSTAKNVFPSNSLSSFWCSMMESYPKISDLAVRVLLPFASTYLCESGFSSLLAIKTKSRNKLSVEDDLRCALAATEPRIHELVAQKQPQKSH
ncbi:SCAN domain-containing protein 3-like [Macrobrachium rosenbergii]|uniref:SCAN domain-containing protein 3-like n=1 Tax=Macrobrachium rosenbergii TaxID=79674 RepID=UPI0034D76E39